MRNFSNKSAGKSQQIKLVISNRREINGRNLWSDISAGMQYNNNERHLLKSIGNADQGQYCDLLDYLALQIDNDRLERDTI